MHISSLIFSYRFVGMSVADLMGGTGSVPPSTRLSQLLVKPNLAVLAICLLVTPPFSSASAMVSNNALGRTELLFPETER